MNLKMARRGFFYDGVVDISWASNQATSQVVEAPVTYSHKLTSAIDAGYVEETADDVYQPLTDDDGLSGTPSPWAKRLGPFVATFEDFPTQGVFAVQSVTASGVVSGGSWTPSFRGVVGSAVAWNANAAGMSAGLEAIPELTGYVIVTGGPWPGTPFSVQILPVTGGAPEPLIVASTNSLTGTTPGVVIATTTVGVIGGPPKDLVTLPDGTYVYSIDIDWASFVPWDTTNSLYIGQEPVVADGEETLNYWLSMDGDDLGTFTGIVHPVYSGVQAGGSATIKTVQVIGSNPVQVIIDQAGNPAPPAFGSMTIYLLVSPST